MIDRKRLSLGELTELIKELIAWNALELCESPNDATLYIPHLMNDAVESYIKLSNYRIQGVFDGSEITDTSVWQVEDGDRHGIVLRQPSDHAVTIWYDTAERIVGCYQYHQIGHNWRKEPGQEYARRLVNLICVIHDKVQYLDEAYVSEEECQIAGLAEFPPVVSYSPINESILEWYPGTEQGIVAMKALLRELQDEELNAALEQYEERFQNGSLTERDVEAFAELLKRPEKFRFWKQIYEWIEKASQLCDVRDYGTDENTRLTQVRAGIEQKYRSLGYQGEYPNLVKTDNNCVNEIFFAEEHPFTVLEWEDYSFRVFSIHISNNEIMNCKMERE